MWWNGDVWRSETWKYGQTTWGFKYWFRFYLFSSILMIKWALAAIASKNSGEDVCKLSGENANGFSSIFGILFTSPRIGGIFCGGILLSKTIPPRNLTKKIKLHFKADIFQVHEFLSLSPSKFSICHHMILTLWNFIILKYVDIYTLINHFKVFWNLVRQLKFLSALTQIVKHGTLLRIKKLSIFNSWSKIDLKIWIAL